MTGRTALLLFLLWLASGIMIALVFSHFTTISESKFGEVNMLRRILLAVAILIQIGIVLALTPWPWR